MRKGIIYVCINLFDGRRYIGKTLQEFSRRKADHIQEAINKNSELYFHRALRKFGIDNFVWSIIESNIVSVVIQITFLEFLHNPFLFPYNELFLPLGAIINLLR